jgi:hypothetical protein
MTAYESPAAIAIGGTVFEYVGISEISFSLPSVGLVTSPGRNALRSSPQKQKAPELVRGQLNFSTLHSLPHFTNLSREIFITPRNIFYLEPVLERGGLFTLSIEGPPLLRLPAPPSSRNSSAP